MPPKWTLFPSVAAAPAAMQRVREEGKHETQEPEGLVGAREGN